MINGIIKLFYSEIVKTKMKQMPNKEYEVKDEFKKIKDVTLRIDRLMLRLMNIVFIVLVNLICFTIDVRLGIGALVVGVLYMIYKIMFKEDVKEYIGEIKSNIEENIKLLINDKIKSKISILSTLLIIGIILDFNWAIIISFMVVFIFTIKDMYSNIRR